MHVRVFACLLLTAVSGWPTAPAKAGQFFFSTGDPDGKIATLSRTASTGKLETETADDFVTTQPVRITSATFTGYVRISAPLLWSPARPHLYAVSLEAAAAPVRARSLPTVARYVLESGIRAVTVVGACTSKWTVFNSQSPRPCVPAPSR